MRTTARYHQSGFLQDNGYTTLTPSLSDLNQARLSATVEFQAQSNVMTSLSNPQECVNSTQKPKLLKKSVEGLTSNVKDCLPYWNEQCVVNSSRLWLPTVTDWQG